LYVIEHYHTFADRHPDLYRKHSTSSAVATTTQPKTICFGSAKAS
jgi:hypothetical protein